MTSHNIYDKCKNNRKLMPKFKHLVVCISYRQVHWVRCSLAQYSLQQYNKMNVPLPSHFLIKMFTLAALDNFDCPQQLSLSGTKSSHNRVMVVFQVEPEKPLPKPLRSSVDLSDISNRCSFILPCQKIVN